MMIDVKGKWALITGASRGIGRELALFMAGEGCNLILHSRKLEGTDEIDSEVRKLGIRTYRVAAELSDLGQINTMLKAVDAFGEDVDFVFNNAGVQTVYRQDYLVETEASDFTDMYFINTVAPMMICYHFLPKMLEKDFGRLINTTSGIQNEPQQAGYSASKAALDKVTKDLGTTLDDVNVTINLTDPGWCRTDLGGPMASCSVESALPGCALPAFMEDGISGRIIHAQEFSGLTLKASLDKA